MPPQMRAFVTSSLELVDSVVVTVAEAGEARDREVDLLRAEELGDRERPGGRDARVRARVLRVVRRPVEQYRPGRIADGRGPDFAASYGVQAVEILLDAIARSDGTRASVMEEVRKTRIRNGLLGDIAFDRKGDLVEGPITILRFHRGEFVVDRVVRVQMRPIVGVALATAVGKNRHAPLDLDHARRRRTVGTTWARRKGRLVSPCRRTPQLSVMFGSPSASSPPV